MTWFVNDWGPTNPDADRRAAEFERRRKEQTTMRYRPGVRPPSGHEDACEPNEDGWPVWKRYGEGDEPPCPGDGCTARYNAEEPAFALECPSCGAAGCSECFPMGRGCPCPECEELEEEF